MISACRACRSTDLAALPELEPLARVTSDCRPWAPGGHLAACARCGLVQKPHEPAWEADCRAIYSTYELYNQAAGGTEQAVYEPGSGMPATRSERLLDAVCGRHPLPPTGRLLDVGCGNGAFLSAFRRRAPGWELHGADVHARHRADVERATGPVGFHVKAPEDVPGEFDWIVLLHVVEHLPAPVESLARLRRKLRPGGRLVIEVPDHRRWPFDLAVADHASHFCPKTLRAVLTRAGFGLADLADAWVPRELSAVAVDGPGAGPTEADGEATGRAARAAVDWLARTAASARALSAGGLLALFGSSIAATWLAGQLGGQVACFLDEDPSRAGMRHLGIPILAPEAAPAGVPVFLALAPVQAADVRRRLSERRPDLRLGVPPDDGQPSSGP